MPIQSTSTTSITVDAEGRLTLPSDLRDALAIDGETWLWAEVVDHGLMLRPVDENLADVPEEDRDVYLPDNVARIQRALREPLENARELSETDVVALMNAQRG